MSQYRKLRRIDLPVCLTDEWKVDSGNELNGGGLVGVVFTAGDLETVDAVLMDGLSVRAHT